LSALHVVRAVARLMLCIGSVLRGMLVCALMFPFMGPARRMRQVQLFSQRTLRSLGLRLEVTGSPHSGPVMLAANHVSWLDILAIDAVAPARFVSKADIRAWPLLGWMVSCGGTLFIERERKRDAMRVVHQVAAALREGDIIAMFPEGTTGSGEALLPFHANLLQAAVSTATAVQPVALRYSDAHHTPSKAAPYIDQVTLVQSLWWVACADRLVVTVQLLPALDTTTLERREVSEQLRQNISQALGFPSTPAATSHAG
jgi:1-acyl-sn-glycerol-3-phosphate acyltransferase